MLLLLKHYSDLSDLTQLRVIDAFCEKTSSSVNNH